MSSIRLRALTSGDIPTTLKWNNQEDIKQLYAGHPFPVNIEMESQWYEKILSSNFPTTVFGIELISSEKLIGIVILKDISLIHRKCEIALFIGEKNERGKGYAKESINSALDFAFNQLGLLRVFLFVQKNNSPAIKLYSSLGFCKEGELRKSIYKNGQFYDEFIMSILKEEIE